MAKYDPFQIIFEDLKKNVPLTSVLLSRIIIIIIYIKSPMTFYNIIIIIALVIRADLFYRYYYNRPPPVRDNYSCSARSGCSTQLQFITILCSPAFTP